MPWSSTAGAELGFCIQQSSELVDEKTCSPGAPLTSPRGLVDKPRRQRRRGRSRSRGAAPRDRSSGRSSDAHEARSDGESVPELLELSPFSVFCALLGITETEGYARQEHAAVARRFDLSDEALCDYLEANGLSKSDLRRADFDLESARLDMKVAPLGISRIELARTLFQELAECEGGAGQGAS